MELPERESMEFDVVIVGAGPAGLSAAIRLKQIDPDLTVVVLEKGGEVGVEIYPGFAASEVLYNEAGAVVGVATGDMGIEKNGEPGPAFTRGMELHGKYTLIGEGVRGSLAKQLIAKFELDKDPEPQKYGIGIKELWRLCRKVLSRL